MDDFVTTSKDLKVTSTTEQNVLSEAVVKNFFIL